MKALRRREAVYILSAIVYERGWGLSCVTVTEQHFLSGGRCLSVRLMAGRSNSRTVDIEPDRGVGFDVKRRGGLSAGCQTCELLKYLLWSPPVPPLARPAFVGGEFGRLSPGRRKTRP